jgi:predicted RNA-binding protein
MCLSTVYMDSKGKMTKVLQDVARMEAGDDGYLFVDLFGGETFVRGRLQRVDFIDDNAIVLEES